MPAHDTAGDGLTLFEEYRGFVLDDSSGFAGEHTRLSSVQKELLVEVDAMANVGVTPADITAIMTDVAAGYRNTTDGGGFRMHWVVDDTARPRHSFPNLDAAAMWLAQQKDAKLAGFVPFAFTVQDDSDAATQGQTIPTAGGSLLYMDRITRGIGQSTHIAAHELVHNLLGGPDEHSVDPADEEYLMYQFSTANNDGKIIFTDVTRTELWFSTVQMGNATAR